MSHLAFHLAQRSVKNHRARARLSSFGVAICVFIISLVLIVSDGVATALNAQSHGSFGKQLIINGRQSDNLLSFIQPPESTLSLKDYGDAKTISSSEIVANQYSSRRVSLDNLSLNSTVVGTTATNEDSLGIGIAGGSWINDSHSDNKPWVVLGYDLANRLIGTDNPQNQIVTIGGKKYTVVGVAMRSSRPVSVYGIDVDNCAFMSLTNSTKLTKSTNLSQIIVFNAGESEHSAVVNQIAKNHPSSDDYQILTSEEIKRHINRLARYILIGTTIVTGLILVISCISIANAILVSVAERRREIGIRKAVGATSHDIVAQFMAESLIISVRAALVGFVLAYLVGATVLLVNHLDIVFSPWAASVGLIIPVVVSIAAGIYPAIKASRQNIIEALNQLT